MPGFGVALAWMIISPFAFLTDCFSIIFILHYKPFYHSCDVAFISLCVTMATNAWLLLPIPAVVKLADVYWSQSLCAFYTWLSITLRCSHILVLLVLNVYWMASLRVSNKSNLFISSKPITVSVCVCWFISLVIGLIPAADVAHVFDYYEDNKCKFLPANISRGFAIFFIIVPLVTTVMGVVSSLDSLLLFKAMKDVALTKYSADRFHLPTISGGIRTSAVIHAKYNELNVTIELCRLVLFFSMASSVLNAVPLLASQFVQLIQVYSRETLETTLLWLLLIEALVLPHLLWLLSKRYRHAVAYTWRVFVLRDTSAREEDAASCSLQAFRLNVKAVTPRPYRNGGVNTGQMNGTVPVADIEEHSQETTRNGDYNTPRSRTNGFLHTGPISGYENRALDYSLDSSGVTTDIEMELTPVKRITSPEVVILHETNHHGITHAQKKGQGYNNVHETSMSSVENNKRDNSTHTASARVISSSNTMDSTQIESPLQSPTATSGAGHVKRSISGSSRIEWKERMMKKHLPTVFLGSSVEDESDTDHTCGSIAHAKESASNIPMETGSQHSYTSTSRQEATSRMSTNWSSTESTYYLSGDYHYDYLNNTLVRTHPHNTAELGESSERYAEEDIDNILDNSLTSETVADKFDSENYLLNSATISEYVSDSDLSKNDTHSPRKIKDLALQSAKIPNREINNAKNGSNIIPKVDVPQKGSPSQESSKGIPEDQTLLDGRSHTGSLSQPTATIISVSAIQPSIRVSNYRKFLAYTDLIISDVDEVTDVGNLEQDEGNGHNKIKDPTFESDISREGGNSPNKVKSTGKDVKDPPFSESLQNLQTNEKKDKSATSKQKANQDVDDSVQDYSKCETVSGSEMLRLKMQSIRSAAAMYFSDDTTSDDGGIDNNGFAETSNDESDDNTSDETQKIRFDNPNITRDDMHYVNKGSNEVKSKMQVSDTDEFAEIRISRDRVVDGEESAAEVPSHGKRVAKNDQGVREKGYSQKELSVNVDVKSKGQNQKEAYIVTDDKQSGDNQKGESITGDDTQRGDSHKEALAILRSGKQAEVNLNETSFIRNDNQGLKSGVRTESILTDHVKTADISPLSEQDISVPWHVGQSKQTNLQNDSYARFTEVTTANEHTINDARWSGAPSSVLESRVLPDENSIYAPTKQPGIIAKPPRHRKHEDESQLLTYNAIKDNSNGTEVDFEGPAIPKSSPYSGNTNYVVPVAEIAVDSDISEVTDSDSVGSDLSVTLEPYGYRRPDWMNDLLLETSSYEQTMYKQAREFSSLEEESTDFMSNNSGNISSDFNLRTQGNPEKSGISYNGVKGSNVSTHIPQSVLIPYQFDDYSDTDNENSIIIDYSAQSNFYRNKNLCFEAIKEEPEDLSDSASSIDNLDISTSYILRDTPVSSNRKAADNFTATYNSAASINQPYSNKPPPFHQNIPKVSMENLQIPTSERTSADGSEEISPPNGSTCLSSTQTATHISIHAGITNKQHDMQQDSSVEDLANQTVYTSSIPALKTVNSTAIQNVHSSSGILKDDLQALVTPTSSVIHRHDPLMTPDHTRSINQYNNETLNYGPSSNGSTHAVTNSRSLDFYNGVQFPRTMEPESSRGEVPGATPVYF